MTRFWYWRGYRVASERNCQKPPPCPSESMPGGSKMDVLLTKAEPISNYSNTSVMRYLRKKKVVEQM